MYHYRETAFKHFDQEVLQMRYAEKDFVKETARDLMVHRGMNCYDALKTALRFIHHFDEVVYNKSSAAKNNTEEK